MKISIQIIHFCQSFFDSSQHIEEVGVDEHPAFVSLQRAKIIPRQRQTWLEEFEPANIQNRISGADRSFFLYVHKQHVLL